MAVAKPSEGPSVCSLTRPLSIVIQRLSLERYPRLQTGLRGLAKASKAPVRLRTQTDPDLVVCGKRTRNAPRRLVVDSAAVSTDMLLRCSRLKSAPTDHGMVVAAEGEGEKAVEAVGNDKQPVRETEDDPGDSGSRKVPAATEAHSTAVSPPISSVGRDKTSSSGGGCGGGGGLGGVRVKVPVNYPRSPPNTRQSTVAGRIRRRQSRKSVSATTAAVRRVKVKNRAATVLGARHRNKSKKRKRVVSAGFLDSSDGGSEADLVLKRRGGEGRQGRGKPPPRKIRRLSSSSGDEASSSQTGQERLPKIRDNVQRESETVPETPIATVSLEQEVEGGGREGGGGGGGEEGGGGGGEGGWTCTSDEDDLAISKRLEELQRERLQQERVQQERLQQERLQQERVGEACVGWNGERVPVEVLPLTCSGPTQILYIYQPSIIGELGGVGGCGRGRGGGGGGGGGRECVDVANLEINPNSIITESQTDNSLFNVPSRDEVVCSTLHEIGANVRIGRPANTGSHKLQFGRTRRRRTIAQTEKSRATILSLESGSSPKKEKVAKEPRRSRSRKRGEPAQQQEQKRKRGRPKKSSSEPNSNNSSKPRGRQQRKLSCEAKSSRGRARKKGGDRGKPSSLSVRRDSGSPPHGSPQNGEDSGYPGSISSSSSHGHKGLKSPQDISPWFNFPIEYSSAAMADKNNASSTSHPHPPPPPPPPPQCRGSINTAELGLFSPEVVDDTHIANFPMPPDPQWVWPTMDLVGVGTAGVDPDSLLANNHGGLDTVSETTTQSLFDPSKMVIAKVESLSDDSRFYDCLNEILESEEVMECLNSISSEPPLTVVEPPQIRPLSIEEAPPAPEVTVPAAGRGVTDKGTELKGSPVAAHTPTTSSTVEPSQQTGVPVSEQNQSSSESVAAYVAAETSLIPFSVAECFTTGGVGVATTAKPAPLTQDSLLNVAASGSNLMSVSSSLASFRTGDLAPKSNVMWSQSGGVAEAESCLKPLGPEQPQLEQQPQQQQQQQQPSSSASSSGSAALESAGGCQRASLQPPISQSSPVVLVSRTSSPPGSSLPPGQPPPGKKKIIRIKRPPKVGKTVTESNKNDGKAGKPANESSRNSGKTGRTAASQKDSVKTPSNGEEREENVSKPPELKSRTGRAIKPSWRLTQASLDQGLRRTNPPSTKASVTTKSSGEKVDDVQAGSKNKGGAAGRKLIQKGKPRVIKTSVTKGSAAPSVSSLSLADVAEGSGLKKLPDIPATTLLSPTPSLSLPSSSSSLSMSLDDILQQMNDEELLEEMGAPEVAEPLPTATSPRGSDNDSDKVERLEEKPAEELVENKGERNDGASQPPTSPTPCHKTVEVTPGSLESSPKVVVASESRVKKATTGLSGSELANSMKSELQTVVKPARMRPSPIRWTDEDSAPPIPLTASRHKPEVNTPDPHRAESEPAGDDTDPRWPAMTQEPAPEPARADANSLLSVENVGRLPAESIEEDDNCSVMMDLDISDDERETLSLVEPLTPSLPPLEASRDILDGGGGEETEEDKIEIFADDFDTFTVYTMEEKAKNATPPRMPSPPRFTSPNPKAPTKPLVRNWLRSQQQIQRHPTDSQRNFASTSPAIPPLFPPSFSATPLPTSHPPPPPLFPPRHKQLFPTHPPPPPLLCDPSGGGLHRHQGHCSSSSLQPLYPPSKPCFGFLKGHCSYKPCKYSHAPLSSYPLPQLESMLLRLPVEIVPMDITEHYVARPPATAVNCLPQLIMLIKGLLNRSWDAAMQAYSSLTGSGVLLKSPLLSRLLTLVREQTQPMLSAFVPLPKLACGILEEIREQGPCSLDDYHSVLSVLNTAQQPIELLDVYMKMKEDGHQPTRDILHLVLRGSSPTDTRILQLLYDSKECLSVTNDIARIANGVLEKVGPQLVSRNLQQVEEWLSGASEVLDILGKFTILKLFNVLVSGQRWQSLLSLLERSPKTVLGLESRVSGPLSQILLQQPSLSDRVVLVLEMMSDDSLASFPPEGWNVVLTQCSLPASHQRAAKFCRVLSRSKKCLDREALDGLLEMSVGQNLSSAATEVLTIHLQFVPPVVPSQTVLGRLCTQLHQEQCHQDLFTIVERLLQCRVAPSLPILQSFVDSCSKEAAYGRLGGVVRRARECGLRLEKIFYQRALVLLRPWGQDQAAISDIYKAIRTIDTGPSVSHFSQKSVSSGAPSPSVQPQPPNECGRSTPASQVSRSSGGPTVSSGRSAKSSKSLEYIYEKTSEPTPGIKPGIVALLESNGRQGQFGAAVSILRNLQDPQTSTYTDTVVHAMWRAVNHCDQKPANAFSSLLEQLAGPASNPDDPDLPICDRWLAAQLGIALLKRYANSEHWQSGFVVLHHLHRHRVDYFAHRKPFAPLPSLKPPHLSLFGLARMAVGTCLKVDSPDFAVQVLKQCQWASECGPGERQERERLVVSVAQRCLNSGLHEDCFSCLKALEGLSTKNRAFTSVAKLFNRLLASVLNRDKVDVDLSSRIYQTMTAGNFPCLPRNFSLLLEKLCGLLQFSTARDLCEQAIDQNFYSPISHGELFSVFLPPLIHHVEVCSLVTRHLQHLSGKLEGRLIQPLTINFEGSRSQVEEALTKGLTPPLVPVFTTSTSDDSITLATVSPTHLRHWLSTHFPGSQFLLERDAELQVNQGEPSTATAPTSEERREPESAAAHNLAQSSSKKAPVTGAAESKKHFRVELCRTIVAEAKPFFQPTRFNSYEDYLHLVKRLTAHLYKTLKPSIKWKLDEAAKSTIKDFVQKVMSQFSIYSTESNLLFES